MTSFGQFEATAFSFPEMTAVAKGAADAAGGINRHRIEVVVCNDQGNSHIAAERAPTAVTDKLAAAIGSVSLCDQDSTPVIQAAKIPYIGNEPLEPEDYSSPVSSPIDRGNPAVYTGADIACAESATQVRVPDDTSAASSGPGGSGTLLAADGVEAGGRVVDVEDFSSSSLDFGPAISVRIQKGARCIGVAETPTAMGAVIGAVRQSADPGPLLSASMAPVPIQVVQALRGAANDMLLTTSAFTPNSPEAAPLHRDLLAEDPSAPVDRPAELSWSAMQTSSRWPKPSRTSTLERGSAPLSAPPTSSCLWPDRRRQAKASQGVRPAV